MGADPIQHVVVLMLENQSFDRMVGLTPGVDGVDSLNPRSNPNSVTGQPVKQNLSTQPRMDFDPPHDYDDVIAQMNGSGGVACSGFVDAFLKASPKGDENEIMAHYDSAYLPSLGTLAKQYVTCNRWFSSVPGPTWPNRFFVNSGTSLGHIDMPNMANFDSALHFYNQPTVFERLSEANKSWKIYFGDFSQTILMVRQEFYAANYRCMSSFYTDCNDAASFPQYVFIEPSFFWPGQNDQHPTSDIRRGDALIASVYNALRANTALWNTTLFVILYDEHGGFYDHVDPREAPYRAKSIPPDGNKTPEGFAFDLFGPRTPAVLVSPMLDPQVLQGVYDHTSLLKYLTVKWGLGPLGNRVPAANDFADELVWRATPRTDAAPLNVQVVPEDPKPADLSEGQEALVAFSRSFESRMANATPPGQDKQDFLADVGQRMLQTVEDVSNHGSVASERLRLFLNSKGANLP
jgi:phospholipase C